MLSFYQFSTHGFLTLIASMQSLASVLNTHANTGALITRASHFCFSWSEVTHHLTTSTGTLKAVAVDKVKIVKIFIFLFYKLLKQSASAIKIRK
jgi:hypothetical protein